LTETVFWDEENKMVAKSLLKVNIEQLLERAGRLTNLKWPREVIEVTLEPKLNILCIRFRKPGQAELGEPIHPKIHVFRDKDTKEITAVELMDIDEQP